MAQQINYIVEGHSINRPPYFNGEDYLYWKDRMRLFIESTSIDMWEIIEDEDYVPTIEQPTSQEAVDLKQPPPVVIRTIPRNSVF